MATIDFNKLMSTVQNSFTHEKKEKKDYTDNRFIKVTRDENNNGSLVVRFLPDKNFVPSITKYSHFAKKKDQDGKFRYFIAECPTTIEEKCPYCEKYLAAWKIKDQDTIDTLKPGKRQEKYIANVLVVKDPANPENNGQIRLFEFGYKIAQILENTINGDPEVGDDPINIYHPVEGANLLLKQSPQGEYISYDGSKFLSKSSIADGEEASMSLFEELIEKTHDLSEFTNPEKFETYEELEKKMFRFEHGYDLEDSNTTKSTTTPKAKETKVEEVVEKPAPKKPEPKAQIEEDDDDFFDSL